MTFYFSQVFFLFQFSLITLLLQDASIIYAVKKNFVLCVFEWFPLSVTNKLPCFLLVLFVISLVLTGSKHVSVSVFILLLS